MTDIEELLTENLRLLRRGGIETSRQEMRLLLAYALDIPVNGLYFYDRPLTTEQRQKFVFAVKQRAEHCPVDKIIGRRGFYKYDFAVNRDVLSPRPDTEILVEEALKLLDKNRPFRLLEFGVGSGCIILSLLAECPLAAGVGIDFSAKALKVAELNARNLGVAERVSWYQLSWFDPNITTTQNGFDMIVSNPPYIPSAEIITLDAEVKDFDPLSALDGGEDGLRDYRRITEISAHMLADNGHLIFECGEGQADDVIRIALQNGFKSAVKAKDLNGIERCIILKK